MKFLPKHQTSPYYIRQIAVSADLSAESIQTAIQYYEAINDDFLPFVERVEKFSMDQDAKIERSSSEIEYKLGRAVFLHQHSQQSSSQVWVLNTYQAYFNTLVSNKVKEITRSYEPPDLVRRTTKLSQNINAATSLIGLFKVIKNFINSANSFFTLQINPIKDVAEVLKKPYETHYQKLALANAKPNETKVPLKEKEALDE